MDDHGAKVNDWIAVVRCARWGKSGPTIKVVALMLASYAKANGTKVFPGIARVAVECELGYSTVRRAIGTLEKAGLIEQVKAGNSRRSQAAEYRLIFHPDLLERVEVLNPNQHAAAIRDLNERNTAAGRARQRRQSEDTISAQMESANGPVESASVSAPERALKPAISAQMDPRLALAIKSAQPPVNNLPAPPAEPPTVDTSAVNVTPGAREVADNNDPSTRQQLIADLRRQLGRADLTEPTRQPEGSDR